MLRKKLIKLIAVTSCAVMVFSNTAASIAVENAFDSTSGDGFVQGLADENAASNDVNKTDEDSVKEVISEEITDTGSGENDSNDEVNDDEAVTDENDVIMPIITVKPPFSSFKDAQNHWGRSALEKAFNDGILNGFEDGTMRPDAKITGAQMAAILVRVMKSSLMEDISNTGIPSNAWYSGEAAQAVALGLIELSEVSSLDSNMIRQRACVMLAEAFQIKEGDPLLNKASGYSDFNDLNNYEKKIFATLVNEGYLQGWNGSLMLSGEITRAEFVTILYRVTQEYLNTDEVKDVSSISNPAVLTGDSIEIKNKTVNPPLWLTGTIKDVSISGSNINELVIRSDSLDELNVTNTTIKRLTIAAYKGDVDLDCTGIDTTVVGNGEGQVILEPNDNDVEIVGNGRTVIIKNNVDKLVISGNKNEIIFYPTANVNEFKIEGNDNLIQLDSKATSLELSGTNNYVYGLGSSSHTVLYSITASIIIKSDEVTDKRDYGIQNMSAFVNVASKIDLSSPMAAALNLTNIPVGKTVSVEWYIDGKNVKAEKITLAADSKPELKHTYSYYQGMPLTSSVSCLVKYTTADGTKQVVSAPAVTVALDSSKIVPTFAQIATKVRTKYSGNYTTQWAIDNDLTNVEKEIFVNGQGYSSSSAYLIWVNIGTQHTSIFLGSQGNWRLVRSGLVSTGAGDCTPRGVFKTTYKQTNWTTSTYTVKPVVRFYGGGYALHSRLYNPGTTTLKSGRNGVGYPLSHGCVRMQADDIQWIYDYVPNGTTVVVY